MSVNEATDAWSRRRLLAVLGVVIAVAAMLIVGLGYAITSTLNGGSSPSPGPLESGGTAWPITADGVRGDGYRDEVAADPMLEAGPDDLKPAGPAMAEPHRILVDQPSAEGPGGIAAGFPHTPEGAVGQLAAIDVAVLAPMSLAYAREVHREWALAGAAFEQWDIAQSIQNFHASAGTVDGDSTVMLTATPVGAQIKGTDGPDWVLACVQLDVTVAVVQETRFGYGHCDRMQWAKGRWMLAAGAAPAQAPSTWPGSQRSLDAGWRLWVDKSDR